MLIGEDAGYLTYSEQIILAIVSYILIFLYSTLLGLTIHNIVRFLILKGKWRVFPLTMFYIFAFLCLAIRTFDCIFIAQITLSMNLFGLTLPALLKICIGIVTELVLIELIISVEQGLVLLASN